MAHLILAEGEYRAARFHPHPGSRAGPYAKDLIFALYGMAAWILHSRFADDLGEGLGTGAFVFLLLLHALVLRAQKAEGLSWPALWILLGGGILVLAWADRWPWPTMLGIVPLVLGGAASLLRLGATDFVRRRRVYHLTDRRLVIQDGTRRRTERSLEWHRVEEVRGHQGPMGQVLGFGVVELHQERRPRAPKDEPRPVETVEGVPHYAQYKHRIEAFVADAHAPAREQAKRSEERRLKDSMHALAAWATRERA